MMKNELHEKKKCPLETKRWGAKTDTQNKRRTRPKKRKKKRLQPTQTNNKCFMKTKWIIYLCGCLCQENETLYRAALFGWLANIAGRPDAPTTDIIIRNVVLADDVACVRSLFGGAVWRPTNPWLSLLHNLYPLMLLLLLLVTGCN